MRVSSLAPSGAAPTITRFSHWCNRLTADTSRLLSTSPNTWKATSKLSPRSDMGLRWDYMQPYHELKNHFTFMNPNVINPSTNTAGALQFAGNGVSGVFCNCKTPVHTDWRNFSPRLRIIAYSVNPTLVIRVGAAVIYSFGGGTGGGRTAGGGGLGAGQSLGYSTTATTITPEVTSGGGAGPAFYLNTSTAYLGSAASSALGLTYPPTPTSVTLASEANLNAGNYLNSAGNVVTASSLAYEDPVHSGQPPEFTMYNLGIQQTITHDLSAEIDYVGNEAHHVFEVGAGQNARGYWGNQLDPAYQFALSGVTGTNASGATVPILTAPDNLGECGKGAARRCRYSSQHARRRQRLLCHRGKRQTLDCVTDVGPGARSIPAVQRRDRRMGIER